MDGDFTSGSVLAHGWVRLAPATALVAASSPKRPSFLHRDLSDEALRTPAEPVFSKADVNLARDEGFAAGHAAGLAEAAASLEAHKVEAETRALGVIAAAMQEGCHLAASTAETAAASLAKAMIAAMAAVVPALIRRSAAGETTAMLAHVLPGLSQEPAVRIEVPPDLVAYIEARCASLANRHRGMITVAGESTMRPGDVQVRWGAGCAQRRPEEIWQAVMQAFDPLLNAPQAEDTVYGE